MNNSRKPLLSKAEQLELSQTIQSGLNGLRKFFDGTPEKILEAAKAKGWNVSKIETARNKLVEGCIGWATTCIKKYHTVGLEYDDLRQAAYLGLIKAALRFDATKAKWSTYATWWIIQSTTRAIHDESRLIRVPVYLCSQRGYEERNRRVNEMPDIPIEDPIPIELHDELKLILDDREIEVIRQRFFYNATLKVIAIKLKLSRERIRQIQNTAIKKLRNSTILKDEYDFLH